MLAIFKREMKAYFTSPIGYIFLASFLIITGVLFTYVSLYEGSARLTTMFEMMMSWNVFMILIPILTMKLLSEEKKLKTDQVLLTSPISLSAIVMGKYFAALCMFLIGLALTFPYVIVLYLYSAPEGLLIFGTYLGIVLVSCAFIAIGVFISSLTENQVVAAILSFAVLFLLWIMSNLSSYVQSPAMTTIMNWVSVYDRYKDFAQGIFNPASAIYYISVAVIFLFLTVRVMEQKRWN